MQTITISNLAEAIGITVARAGVILKDLPFFHRPRDREKRFYLAEVLPILTKRHRPDAANLQFLSNWDGDGVYCPLSIESCQKLVDWLEITPVFKERLKYVRTHFCNGLVSTTESSQWFSDLENLRIKIAASPFVLPYLIHGEKVGLPFFPKYSRAFAVVNGANDFDISDAA